MRQHGMSLTAIAIVTALSATAIIALAVVSFAILIDRVSPGAYAVIDLPSARLVPLSGGSLRIESRGEAPATVLFLHGFNGELGNWDPVWRQLAVEPCPARLLRIDIPGFGASEWPSDDYGLAAQGRRVVELLDSLGIGAATLVGTSMGGSLAAWIAAEHPSRVDGLLLLAPSGYPGTLTYGGLFGALVRPGLLNGAATRVVKSGAYRSAFPNSRALQALTVTASYGPSWVEALGRIRTPTVVAWSRTDRVVPVAAAEPVAAAIPGSTLIMVSDSAGHGIPAAEPSLVARTACRLTAGATR